MVELPASPQLPFEGIYQGPEFPPVRGEGMHNWMPCAHPCLQYQACSIPAHQPVVRFCPCQSHFHPQRPPPGSPGWGCKLECSCQSGGQLPTSPDPATPLPSAPPSCSIVLLPWVVLLVPPPVHVGSHRVTAERSGPCTVGFHPPWTVKAQSPLPV